MDAHLDGDTEVLAERGRETESKLSFRFVRDLVRKILNNPSSKKGIAACFALFATRPKLLAGPACGAIDSVGENLALFASVIVCHAHRSVRAKFT